MYEIEIKAWVDDVKKTKEILNSFAKYKGHLIKTDEYWKNINGNKPLTVRFRTETFEDINKKNVFTKSYFTYKRKELRETTEVNEEFETEIQNINPIKQLLLDIEFSLFKIKQKDVEQWIFENATLELCNVKTLGNFLEIEILSEKNDEETIEKSKEKLLKILDKANISRDEIETRYYNEMLS